MSDSKGGGIRCVSYRKTFPGRILIIQLWGDLNHRVVFRNLIRDKKAGWYPGQATLPTDFTTPEGMVAAIEIETKREPKKISTLLPTIVIIS